MSARLLALLAFFLALTGLAQAQTDTRGEDGGETRVFQSVYVPPGEVVHGDVNVVFGDAQIAGIVTGNCNAVFGTCAVVDGGQLGGQVNSVTGDAVHAFIPWTSRRPDAPFAEQDRALMVRLASSAIVLLFFLLFPLRMRVALDRVERHPALAAATGVFALLALVPIAIVLCMSLIGIPLVPVELLAVLGGIWLGTGAIALLIGRRLCELVMPTMTPSPLVALILGLVVISAAETVPILGWVVSALIWLVGLGAAILAFMRSTNIENTVQRAPIGGPPMRMG
ncbi:MAG: hypothetical protein ABR975_04115 [Vulcanimicrobiaceae bacterium]